MDILNAPQSRAARGWIDWSQSDLASAAKVSLSTVRDFEKGRRTPLLENARAMMAALESQGVILLFDTHGNPLGISVRVDSSLDTSRRPG